MLWWAPLNINHCLQCWTLSQDNFQKEEFTGQRDWIFLRLTEHTVKLPSIKTVPITLSSVTDERPKSTARYNNKQQDFLYLCWLVRLKSDFIFIWILLLVGANIWKYSLTIHISSVKCLFLSFLHFSYHFGRAFLRY